MRLLNHTCVTLFVSRLAVVTENRRLRLVKYTMRAMMKLWLSVRVTQVKNLLTNMWVRPVILKALAKTVKSLKNALVSPKVLG